MNLLKTTAWLFAVAALSACGGGGGGTSGASGASPETVNLTGAAGKGLLIGADVRAYEVVRGSKSSAVWASATTSSVGAYVLQGTPTSNPIVVEVTANGNTKMLDESQPQSDGTFKQVDAPANLKLRSFVETLTQDDSVQVNLFTESAVALASMAKNSAGTPVGLTKNSLLAAKQFAQQMAPEGVSPFFVSLPTKTSDLSDDKVAKMSVMMAGIMQKARDEAATCDLQCQVEKLAKDVPITLDDSGRGSIDSVKASAMAAQKVAYLTAGQAVMTSKSAELGAVLASTVNSIAAATISVAQTNGISTSTLSASEYDAVNGVQGFVNTLRTSFKVTETRLKEAQASLQTKYHALTVQGLDKLDEIVGQVAADCLKETQFSCTQSVGSNVTWTAADGDWVGTATSSEGYTISGRVRGSVTPNSSSNFTLVSGSVKNGAKTLVEINNITGRIIATGKDNLGKVTSGTATFSGSVKAFDQALNSDLAITLALSNVEMKTDKTKTPQTFSVAGKLDLTSNRNDVLTGSISASGISRQLSQTWTWGNNQSYTYTYTDDYITQATLNLTAKESSQGEILALAVSGTRALVDPTQVESVTNYATFDVSGSITLAANTKVTLAIKRPNRTTLTQSVDLQSGLSKLNLSGNYAQSTSSPDKWCTEEEGVVLCTDSLSLSANDGAYTAVVKKSSAGTTADLYKGNSSTGTKIGVVSHDGMIQIDGKEYSLY